MKFWRLEVRGVVSHRQLSHNLQFSIMGLSVFRLIVTFCDFDDEIHALNSCEFKGMITSWNCWFMCLKLMVVVVDKLFWWFLLKLVKMKLLLLMKLCFDCCDVVLLMITYTLGVVIGEVMIKLLFYWVLKKMGH